VTTTAPEDGSEQLAMLAAPRRRAPRGPDAEPPPLADHAPVARVAVDVALAHLDRPFDYAVPADLDAAAQPGVRVRVRFAGRLVDGFLLERAEQTEHAGRLTRLAKVVSPEPVLSPAIAGLARAVAERYAGSSADVLRLAVPPRHARAEAAALAVAAEPAVPAPAEPAPAEPEPEPAEPRHRPEPGGWADYDGGRALLDTLYAGGSPRAVWSALPGPRWPEEVATAVATTVAAGRGALVVVPDLRDLARVDAALVAALGPDRHVVLTADLGPERRYRRWLAVRRQEQRVVVGTRAAMFAPVADPGLFVVWDDGDDLHAEPRAPYPHVREVLALRAAREGAGLLVGGHSRTAEGAALVASGWARSLTASRQRVRAAAPQVQVSGDDAERAGDAGARAARLPSLAWRTARDGLRHGPVLVQVPRRGYLPGLACRDCRRPARCTTCHGPLGTAAGRGTPQCAWCGRPAQAWTCPHCEGHRLRATAVGAVRTAEELGRAFPGTVVRHSGGDTVLASVPDEPALVVATPGAEPVAASGYAAALLLDGWAMLSRPDLRVDEEALRRWLGAAALVRPAGEGGRVVIVAEPEIPAVQALVRWDPASFAERELAERATLHLPPAAAVASLTGSAEALRQFIAAAQLPEAAEVLGPVEVASRTPGADDAQRLIVRVPRRQGRELAAALHAAAGVRSAHKDAGAVRIQVDPSELA
jgi:primosomal protein N' (replication factor Y) (superfamily II helicase)